MLKKYEKIMLIVYKNLSHLTHNRAEAVRSQLTNSVLLTLIFIGCVSTGLITAI